MAASKPKSHWSKLDESGSLRGILFLLWLHRWFGRGLFSVILVPVSLYFFIFKSIARRSSYEFLQTHAKKYPDYWKRKPGYVTVIRHMYSFGQSILDKLLAWSIPIDEKDFELANPDLLANFMEKQNGQLIIGSHLGNLEFCRGFVQRYKSKTINALVYDQHSANFVNAMQALNPESRINIYQVNQLDIPLILQLKTKIDAGEWLFIAGDRIPLSGERTVTVSFFDRPTEFAIGPYMLAKVLQCEVQLMFSYRKGKKIYFELVHFADRVTLPRKDEGQQLLAYTQQYASELERQAAQAPLQWFNFFPYWQTANQLSNTAS